MPIRMIGLPGDGPSSLTLPVMVPPPAPCASTTPRSTEVLTTHAAAHARRPETIARVITPPLFRSAIPERRTAVPVALNGRPVARVPVVQVTVLAGAIE